ERPYTAYDGTQETMLVTAAKQASVTVGSDQNATVTLSVHGQQIGEGQVAAGATFAFALHDLLGAAELKERDYNLRIDAVNEQGDRSVAYRKLFVDRTGPLLIVSGGDDADGQPLALNGTVTSDSKLYIG